MSHLRRLDSLRYGSQRLRVGLTYAAPTALLAKMTWLDWSWVAEERWPPEGGPLHRQKGQLRGGGSGGGLGGYGGEVGCYVGVVALFGNLQGGFAIVAAVVDIGTVGD